jgi:putative flavoprotein involved in K+ transport
VLEDGRTLEVANIIWSTGFNSGFSSWIDLPIFNEQGFPIHNCGVVDTQPGLYFVGLHFLYAMSSAQIHGVGRDAKRIVNEIAARSAQQAPAVEAVQLASG